MSNKKLLNAILKLKSKKELQVILEDLFTPQELEIFEERLEIIKELKKGLTQRKVAAKLGVSVSKVTRGAHVLRYGKGGFDGL